MSTRAPLLALFLSFCGLAQTPQKPLRERLLDRAQQGDAEAQYDLGVNFETGRIGLPKDLTQAMHWYREAADRGEPFAAASLGIMYQFGKGVPRDYFQALVWFERSVAHLTGGDRATVVEHRDEVVTHLTPTQVDEARRVAKDWKPTADRW